MKAALAIVIVVVLIVGGATIAPATTLTFDNIPNVFAYGSPIPNGYGGLTWNNFYCLDGADSPNTGYDTGMVSSPCVAYNGFGDPASMSGSPIALNSAYFTGVYNNGLNIQADGYSDGNIIDSADFLVNAAGPTFMTFNWSGVDEVQFTSSGGTMQPGGDESGTQFAMDNLTINAPVPEPSTFLLLCVSAVGLLGCAWRRRRPKA